MVIHKYARELERGGVMASSIEKRIAILHRCQRHLGKSLLDATTDDLIAWLDGLRVIDRTRYAYISHLGCFWDWAILEELTSIDPTRRVRRPKVRLGLPRPIATDDLRAGLDAASGDRQMLAILCCMAFAGARCCEVAALETTDVMSALRTPSLLLHGKGGKQRVVPMHPNVADSLRLHGLPGRGHVFRRADGRRLPAWKISHMVAAHFRGIGIDATAHQLRHWFGTAAYEASKDLRMVQELMGHSRPDTTAGYTAWAQSEAAGVVARLAA